MTVAAVEFVDLSHVTDAALLTQVPSDRVAMGELARRYAGYVHAIARRQTGDPHLADDITQAVFLVLWRKAHRIRPHVLSAWLHQTTRYAAANANRGARRRLFHESRAARTEAIVPTNEHDTAALQAVLDDAIAALPTGDRQLVIDRYLRQIDTATLAAEVGLSNSAIQKRIERAVDKLRATLARRARLAGGMAVTSAAVTAALAAATPSPAPAGLIAAILAPASTSAAITALAHGVLMTSVLTKAKSLIGIAILLIVGGAAAEVGRRHWQAQSLSRPPAIAPAAGVAATLPDAPNRVIGKLKNGATIEFIGSALSPSRRQPWFDAAGQPVKVRPHDAVDAVMRPSKPAWREYAFIITGARAGDHRDEAEATLHVWVDSSRLKAGDKPFKPEVWFPTVGPFRTMRRLYDRYAILTNTPEDQPLTIGFKIAGGPWQSVLKSQADRPSKATAHSIERSFNQPFEHETGAAAVVYRQTAEDADASHREYRTFAVDRAGKRRDLYYEDLNIFSPDDKRAVPGLARMINVKGLDQKPLSEVIDYLSEAGGLKIEPDWPTIAAAGYDSAKPVTIRVDQMTVGEALHDSLSTSSGSQTGLVAIVENGVVRVSTSESFHGRIPRTLYVPGVRLSQLDHFEVESRAFGEWVEFANLPPMPGQATKVTVRTSDNEAQAAP